MVEEIINPFEGVQGTKVMVGIPAYNEEKSVGRIVTYAKKYASFVVVINDCSTDNTVKNAEAAGAYVISHETNLGYGGALQTIFETAQKYHPDVLVILDSDGQHNPEDIPRFVAKIQEGYDVVQGSRYLDKNSKKLIPFYRKIGMRALDKSARITTKKLKTTDVFCGYRAFNKKAYHQINKLDHKMRGGTEILVHLAEIGMKFTDLSVDVRYDLEDTSTQSPVSLGLDLLSGIIQMISIRRPLLFFGCPGLTIFIAGIILAYYSLTIQAETMIFPVIPTIVSLLLVLSGSLLCTASIIIYAISGALKDNR